MPLDCIAADILKTDRREKTSDLHQFRTLLKVLHGIGINSTIASSKTKPKKTILNIVHPKESGEITIVQSLPGYS